MSGTPGFTGHLNPAISSRLQVFGILFPGLLFFAPISLVMICILGGERACRLPLKKIRIAPHRGPSAI